MNVELTALMTEPAETAAVSEPEETEPEDTDLEPTTTEDGPRRRERAGFWTDFLTVDRRWLGVFRILYGTLLIVDLLRRWAVARFYYTNDGILPNHFSLFRPMGGHLFSLYHAFSSLGEVSVAFAVTLCIFVAFTLGYRTRLFHILSVLCITSLNARNIFVENGGTVVVNILGVWTMFMPLGSRFSIDALRSSLRAHDEHTARELNDRGDERSRNNSFTSVVVLALILQWSIIYFFNVVHKTGHGWRNGSAIYWFVQQNRIVTAFGVWMRTHMPFWVFKVMTKGALGLEGVLSCILLIPFARAYTRRVALLLALALHGGIASMSRLGPFSYVMTMQFVIHLAGSDFDYVARWFARPARARTVIYDADCGLCLYLCRLLKRLDPCERLTFIGNDERERIPASIASSLLDETLVVIRPDGSLATEERAVFELARALPFGVLPLFWLRLPGGAQLGRYLYRLVAKNRLRISAWLGFGECGIPRPDGGSALEGSEPPRSLRGDVLAAVAPIREGLVLLLMLALGVQALGDNPWANTRIHVRRPEWVAAVAEYPRIYQGWSMFAPEPPYDDGHLVVDGRTEDGRKLDPFTGREPDFDPYPAAGWGDDQLWCDYTNRLRFPNNAPNRVHLREYLLRWHEFMNRPHDRLVSFDVWWVQGKSPEPGQKRGQPLPPERLTSSGTVLDSGATPWLPKPPPPSVPPLVGQQRPRQAPPRAPVGGP
ncbi:MAG TPA: DCC1-like thiol-disulfide oxidoreductase family protein [Polyangiaceae bacterium]